MARVYRLDSSGELVSAEEKPFTDEVGEMEPFIKKNSKILGDLFIFGEQVISSGRDKRTDLLAVDKDGEIQIIELKKGYVASDILNQVLGYKLYWKKNPDSVKTIWSEFANKPTDVKPDWDNYNPKIVIVAPAFNDELVEIAAEDDLGIRFVQVARYVYQNSTFIVVTELEPVKSKVGPVLTKGEYGWDWYVKEVASEEQIKIAKEMYDSILKFSQAKGWKIEAKFNKWYIAFKYNSRRPFWLDFRGKSSVGLGTNLSDEQDNPGLKTKVVWQWDKVWAWWYTEVSSTPFDVDTVSAALESAYQSVLSS